MTENLTDSTKELMFGGINFFGKIIKEFSQNSLFDYLFALGILFGLILLSKVISHLFFRKLESKKIKDDEDSFFYTRKQKALSSGSAFLYVFSAYIALQILTFSMPFKTSLNLMFMLLLTFFGTKSVSHLVVLILERALRTNHTANTSKSFAPIIYALVWVLGLTLMLDNLGVKISSLLAGLGIMGIAVGLAGQAILADFFAYLVILLDRPFVIGDTIVVEQHSGVVEKIGLKTTSLCSLTGEILAIPNSAITKVIISNYRPAKTRSRTFKFKVTYDTPVEKLHIIPQIIMEVIKNVPTASLDRCHFVRLETYGLEYEVVFTVAKKTLVELLSVQEKINLALMERFSKEGILFAYPSQGFYSLNNKGSS